MVRLSQTRGSTPVQSSPFPSVTSHLQREFSGAGAAKLVNRAAFSLVDVVLALGICSFALMAIVGMIPVGLSTFRDAMNTTAQSQIVQSLASEVLLTDTNFLAAMSPAPLFYDDQGTVVDASSDRLAYTAKIEKEDIESPAGLSSSSGATMVIRIARTHPGQDFEEVESKFPESISSYPVVVAYSNQVR